jgi:anti-anti-sigma regulatory factor
MHTVELQGEATLYHCNEIRAQLQEAVEADQEIHISLDGVRACDLSLFQLLWATKRSCDARGAAVTVRLPLPEAVQERAVALGWFRSKETIPSEEGSDLWSAPWGGE